MVVVPVHQSQHSSIVRYRIKYTILSRAGVDLESLLVGEDVDLDTRERTGHSSDRSRYTPVVGSVLLSVDEPAGVVTNTSATAATNKIGRSQVGTKLLGRGPEIENTTLLVGQDSTVGDENAIDGDTLSRVRQVHGVVVDSSVVRVLESVKVPVDLNSISIHVRLVNQIILRENST
jgi:hypothetical protein